MRKMLFVGEQWFGSNSRSLSCAFRRCGYLVEEIDPSSFVPSTMTLSGRLANRALTSLYESSFNHSILEAATATPVDIVFVYKGARVRASTLATLKDRGVSLALYYPDVSLYTHGANIPKCVAKYNVIFTAKSFGIADLKALGANNAHLVLHGCDPEVHRELPSDQLPKEYQCDASFIGTWSPKKQRILEELVALLPDVRLKVWGAQWRRASSGPLARYLMHHGVLGDFYAAAIQSSKINLAILSEARTGSSSGDLTTARTFEIPGCSAFMLHERTDELLRCFKEDVEVACFSTTTELAEKVQYYLNHDSERAAISSAGYNRCMSEHSYAHRAGDIVDVLRRI